MKIRGFTLFEMMVSVGIFVMITTIGVLNYRKFGNDIFITNLGYDIALSIRKAQSYGINVKEAKGTNIPTSFNYAYGINFAVGPTTDKTLYYLFADVVGLADPLPNGKYDGSQTFGGPPTTVDETVEKFKLLKRSTVSKLCIVRAAGGPDICSDSCDVYKLDLTFYRPNPDARITFSKGTPPSVTTYAPETNKAARIYIQTPDGREKQIVVYSVGQISVQEVPSGQLIPIGSCNNI
jgi:prepilin-type N-terminal cleavage/methylation domain-containing protein